ncbi:NAD-P-binding protein [Mycena belliarum]|uniref:NAD-P-binding protein n=1 Tax=Mycena belliarum TaxID=1033014 RepID=A0AAD6UAF0_9AGAR|nr:NAD-P-binding protein [Mycena belliae]
MASPTVSIDNAKCVLVIGATSGIGRALALAIAELPSRPTVIAAGRRQDRLDELKAKKLETVQIDVAADLTTLKKTVDSLVAQYPDLDAVMFASGIQYQQDFTKEVDLTQVAREINVNYLAVVSLISMFLPHFLKLSADGRPSFIMPVSSGLGLMPSNYVPNYSASKAALTSFAISLRKQLAATNVKILEIIPPLVESELHDEQGTTGHLSNFWMPLDEYTERTMGGLRKGDTRIASGTAEKVLKRYQDAGLCDIYPIPV